MVASSIGGTAVPIDFAEVGASCRLEVMVNGHQKWFGVVGSPKVGAEAAGPNVGIAVIGEAVGGSVGDAVGENDPPTSVP